MGWIRSLLVVVVTGFCLSSFGDKPDVASRMFGAGRAFVASDLPQSALRNRLEQLPEPARQRAMAWLHEFDFPPEDVNSLTIDDDGGVFYVCEFPADESGIGEEGAGEPVVSSASVPVSPFPDSLKFSSRPGATNIIFLDFSGSNITGTAWNNSLGRSVIPATAFSMDSDFASFNDSEQAVIKRVWQRVAEDFAPFDVDVTTVRPSVMNNRVCHVLITRNTDSNGAANPSSAAGGVAYVNVYGASNFAFYRPAWVYYNNLSNSEANIAEAASHEAGHNLGLSHDGQTNGTEYYRGHGSGATSWAPIMGVGYGKAVTQWSKGEYHLANNTQDDLAIIAGKLRYRDPDHGNTPASASFLSLIDNTQVRATTLETDPANSVPQNKGVLERSNDVDLWAFSSGSGFISLTVFPWISPSNTRGGNLDVAISLLDSSGQTLATNNPISETFGIIQHVVTSGIYYLKIENAGFGNPTSSVPTGYTTYGSIGYYFITGYVADASGIVIPPQASLAVAPVDGPGATSHSFQVTYTDNIAIRVQSIDDNDVRVTGPGGYSANAQLVSLNQLSDGTPRTATYRIAAPGGVWSENDNGIYTVWINSNQVEDVEGAFVAAGSLGTFSVSVPQVVYAAYMNTNPGWTLGSGWAYGKPAGSSGDPSSGATGTNVVGFNLGGAYSRNTSVSYATTPAINVKENDSVILRFRRWLGIRSGDSATIQVTSNGVNWVAIWSSSGDIIDTSWQIVQFNISAQVAGSTNFRVRWGLSSNNDGRTSFGWNLDDVEILGTTGVIDTTPPEAQLLALDITQAGGVAYDFTVTYTDESGVNVSGLGDENIVISGPGNYLQSARLIGVDDFINGSPRTATYQISPPSDEWGTSDNGEYIVTLMDAVVSDIFGNFMPGGELGRFNVAIPDLPPEKGGIVITITPAEAVASGAMWRLSGLDDVWRESGDVAGDLDPGLYAVTFLDAAGWNTPVDVFVQVTGGEASPLTVHYEARLTENFDIPIWWLEQNGFTNDYEGVVQQIGANGMALWQSYIAGLDPNNPASVFVLDLSELLPGDVMVLRWVAVSGRVYSIYRMDQPGHEPLPVPSAQDIPWPINTYTNQPGDDSGGILQIRVRLP